MSDIAQNPLDTFPCSFPIDRKVAKLLATSYGHVKIVCRVANKSITSWQPVVMEFGKQHDVTDTTDFCPRQLVTDLLRGN